MNFGTITDVWFCFMQSKSQSELMVPKLGSGPFRHHYSWHR